MAPTTEQDFFGGAIRGVVPQRWMDASNLREIPDHQELFLSPETLSNLIIEINQRVSQEDALNTFATLSHQNPTLAAGSGSAASASQETIDQAAALYHLNDLCDEGDALQVITPPQRAELPRLTATAPAGSSISAYKGVVQFQNAPKQGRGQAPAMNGTSATMTQLTCHYLLVRLAAQETDLLVFFNVPHEEFDKAGDVQGLSREEAIAEDTVSALVGGLEIRDWSLFV
ncbi:hypothetical protein N7481_009877 [Penicillium waksmanii]|uniref:uncharacterized protein n=1 Tax=Penicillium waksmanii TaxID=69791 RepID=UPI00254779F0|nr:uncharacterized protein N7481_009877 [Penicillium waksmanii]KAJ5976170.1 hypothetical protein N7481_009877 [Penicillium waksmanii]